MKMQTTLQAERDGTIGLVFLLPFLWFLLRRRLERRLAWQLVLGLVFIACVLFFPRGVWGSIVSYNFV